MKYLEFTFRTVPCTEIVNDVLSGVLGEAGFESFVEQTDGITAYIQKELYNESLLKEALADFPLPDTQIEYNFVEAEDKDWNEEWEKNFFQPIVIGDRCCIHSTFHKDTPKTEYEILINPQMAFGTGHHETTSMMIGRLLNNNLEGLSLLDMGTGTGILAILAAMRGAEKVVGVEIDPAAYENAVDNIKLNDTPGVELRLGGAETVTETGAFDFVMANINRNIILDDIAVYARAMKPKGRMFLSGFYVDDIDMIVNAARALGLCLTSVIANKNWANICFTRIEDMNFTE